MADITSFFAAGLRNVTLNPLLGETITPLTGSNTGAGNQGTSNTANLQGHAGTPASQTGMPRQIKGGSSMLGTV